MPNFQYVAVYTDSIYAIWQIVTYFPFDLRWDHATSLFHACHCQTDLHSELFAEIPIQYGARRMAYAHHNNTMISGCY